MMSLQGALAAGLVDYPSESILGSQGWAAETAPAVLAASRVVRATMEMTALASIGQPDEVEGITVTARNGYHLLRLQPPPRGARLVFYVWLDREASNLTVTEQHMKDIVTEFSAPWR
jgi:hypothetical protein